MHLSFNRKIRSKSTKKQIFSIRFDPPNVWGWSATSKTSTWCKKCLLGDGPVINRRISVAGWIHMIFYSQAELQWSLLKVLPPIFWTSILADCVGDSSMLSLEGKWFLYIPTYMGAIQTDMVPQRTIGFLALVMYSLSKISGASNPWSSWGPLPFGNKTPSIRAHLPCPYHPVTAFKKKHVPT